MMQERNQILLFMKLLICVNGKSIVCVLCVFVYMITQTYMLHDFIWVRLAAQESQSLSLTHERREKMYKIKKCQSSFKEYMLENIFMKGLLFHYNLACSWFNELKWSSISYKYFF